MATTMESVAAIINLTIFIIFSGIPNVISEAEDCFRSNDLNIITRNDPGFNYSNQQFWTDGTVHRPQGFIQVRNAFEVQRAVLCAKRNGINLAIKSGGHSMSSYSFGCNNSWVIDLKRLNKICVHKKRQTVTIGSGVISKPLEDRLWKYGFALPLGTCNAVGVSGISTGGGIGILQRQFGLTVDQITSLEVVTADGHKLNVSGKHERDLFWALRGGVASNFGIVTKLTLKIHKAPKCNVRIRTTYDNKFAGLIYYKWQKYFTSPEADNSVMSQFEVNYLGQMVTKVDTIISTVTEQHCEQLIQKMKTTFPNITDDSIIRYDNYIDAQYNISNENGVPRNSWPVCDQSMNFFVNRPLTFEECQKAVDIIINSGTWAYMETFGGVINKQKRDQMAFVHRFSYYNVMVSFNATCDGNDDVQSWEKTFLKFSSIDSGESYQNYVKTIQSNYLERYYGDNLPRLIEIKNKYDPQNFFCFPQSIPLDLNNQIHACSCTS